MCAVFENVILFIKNMKNFYGLKFTLCFLLFILVSSNVKSEDLNNEFRKDKTPKLSEVEGQGPSYLAFHPCYLEAIDSTNFVSIYVISATEQRVTIEIPGNNFVKTLNAKPYNVTEFKLTPEQAFPYIRKSTDTALPEQIFAGGAIIIRSDDIRTCYGVLKFKDNTEGFFINPATSIGKNYQVSTDFSPDESTYTSIVGCYDNTKVTFTLGGYKGNFIIKNEGDTLWSGTSLRRTINDGDVWLIPGKFPDNNITGSLIAATKPVYVISGNYSGKNGKNSPKRNYQIEEEVPSNVWGTKYYVSPIISRKDYPIIQIFAKKPNTQIYADGVPMWKITSPIDNGYVSYIEARAGTDGIPAPVVISSDDGFPINVVQYNREDNDNSFLNTPFKMQVLSIGQFNNYVEFTTPVIYGNSGLDSNYLNIVYKADKFGQIPDDFMYSRVIDGKYKWMKLNEFSNDPGQPFKWDATDLNGRTYYCKTMKLPAEGVYMLKSNESFAAYLYGTCNNSAYGYNIGETMLDLEIFDTLAPSITYTTNDCNGNIDGTVTDEPQIDPENRSKLGLIYMDRPNSYNYLFTVKAFEVGTDASTNWQLSVIDKAINAKAHVIFQDRAGYVFDTVFNYTSYFPKILDSNVNFGIYNSINPPINVTKTFTLKNITGKDTICDKYRIYLSLDSKIKDTKTDDINTYQNFDLIDVEGKDFAALKTDEEIKFDVKFTGDKFGYFRDSIGLVIIDKETNDTCSVTYFTEITALIAQSYIIAEDFDFKKHEIGKRSDTVTLKISNLKTDEFNSVKDFRITSIETSGDFVGSPGSEYIFEVDGLHGISKTNPLIIEPGKELLFKVCFKPISAISYESKISFISEDSVNMPDNVTILKGIGEVPSSVNNNDTESELVFIFPNPASDYIEIYFNSITPTLKRGVDERSDIQIFDMLGINVSPAGGGIKGGGKIDISNLSSGIYFIRIGNRVEKFVKI
jgi:hypothetical protein